MNKIDKTLLVAAPASKGSKGNNHGATGIAGMDMFSVNCPNNDSSTQHTSQTKHGVERKICIHTIDNPVIDISGEATMFDSDWVNARSETIIHRNELECITL